MCDRYATHACLCTPMKGCQKSEETEVTGACSENAARAVPCLELLLLVLIHLPGVAFLEGNLPWEDVQREAQKTARGPAWAWPNCMPRHQRPRLS